MYDQLKEAGVPVPETVSATALTGVEETAAVHLMSIKLGGIAATICPCEQFTDTALNIESRLDKVDGNFHEGFDWTERKTPSGRDWCVPNEGEGTWTCADPRNPSADLAPISDLAYRRMRAQIHNDAAGWETDLATLGSEAEPADPEKIKGNFTHEEHTEHGYNLVLSVGMGNDYWGYMPEYREMRSHDHYRKALNGLGPHGADYVATRLSRLAASLNGGADVELSALDRATAVEQARAQSVADGLGELARAYITAYERTLPADGGTPAVVKQPADITRFSTAHLEFVGGSNYSDLPDVRVERRVDGAWRPYGDTTGDVQLMATFPKAEELGAWRAGAFEWHWTAVFEAFSSDAEQPDAGGAPRRQTPAGTYRFVVDGRRRPAPGADLVDYRLESRPFTVSPWAGITVESTRLEADRTVSFGVGPTSQHAFGTDRTYTVGPVDYPDAYDSPFRFLDGQRRLYTYGLADPARHQQYCPRCTFRPWADTGEVVTALVTIDRPSGRDATVPATYDTTTRRWRTAYVLRPGESARVAAGGLTDAFGETNGAAGATVSVPAAPTPGKPPRS